MSQLDLNLVRLPADVVYDDWLLHRAIKHAEPGSSRHAFILRLRRSFRDFGSLTTAMREALKRG